MMFTVSIINNFVGAGDFALTKFWERDTRNFNFLERDTCDWCAKKRTRSTFVTCDHELKNYKSNHELIRFENLLVQD